MLDIRANLGRVQEAVARACARAGRSSDDVLLIAVSKTMDAERVRMAVAAGVVALGENRVQEAREKIEALGRPVPWHLIGSLGRSGCRGARGAERNPACGRYAVNAGRKHECRSGGIQAGAAGNAG